MRDELREIVCAFCEHLYPACVISHRGCVPSALCTVGQTPESWEKLRDQRGRWRGGTQKDGQAAGEPGGSAAEGMAEIAASDDGSQGWRWECRLQPPPRG